MRIVRAAVAMLFALSASAHAGDEILVSAAASLSRAFKQIGADFEAANPGARVSFNFGASGALLRQIEKGAPVDVFASADQETMDQAQQRKLIVTQSRRNFTTNRLALIAPALSKHRITDVAGLSRPEIRRIAIGNPTVVPAGRYAHAALGTAQLEALKPKFIYADSVVQALQYTARGEVDAAFVYASDAAAMSDKVKVAALLPTPGPITYPVALVAAGKRQASAQRLADYLATARAQAALKRYGFGG